MVALKEASESTDDVREWFARLVREDDRKCRIGGMEMEREKECGDILSAGCMLFK